MGALVVVILVGAVSQYWLGEDNAVEQISEQVIKNESGVDIDLSPRGTEPGAASQNE